MFSFYSHYVYAFDELIHRLFLFTERSFVCSIEMKTVRYCFCFIKDEIYSCILIQLLCKMEINCSLIYADPGIAFNRKVRCLFRVRVSSHLRIAVHKCIFI